MYLFDFMSIEEEELSAHRCEEEPERSWKTRETLKHLHRI